MNEENENTEVCATGEIYDITMESGEHSLRVRCMADLPEALQGFRDFLATLPTRATRAPSAAPSLTDASEEETLAELYRAKTGKRFKHMGSGSRLDGLRDWHASLPPEVASEETTSEAPEMTEEEAENIL